MSEAACQGLARGASPALQGPTGFICLESPGLQPCWSLPLAMPA